jgi:hypothetical protein
MIGEWWFYDGQAVFADGDVGDTDHIMHAAEHHYIAFAEALQQTDMPTLQELGQNLELSGIFWAGDEAWLRTQLNDWADAQQKAGHLTVAQADDVYVFIRKKINWSELDLQMLTDDEADIRLYAVQVWGWIRSKKNDIELWHMTKRSLQTLSAGIGDTQDDEIPLTETFNIEERKTGLMYHDVPLSAIDTADAKFIREKYRTSKFNTVHL